MRIMKSLAFICLIIFLIFQGLINIGVVTAPAFALTTGIFAILAGIFTIVAFSHWVSCCCHHKDHDHINHSNMDRKL